MAGEEAIIAHVVQKRIVRRFLDHCATDPRQAATLETIGVKRSPFFKHMLKKSIFIAVDENRYYLDEDAAERFFQRKRRAFFIMFSFALLALVIYLLFGGRFK